MQRCAEVWGTFLKVDLANPRPESSPAFVLVKNLEKIVVWWEESFLFIIPVRIYKKELWNLLKIHLLFSWFTTFCETSGIRCHTSNTDWLQFVLHTWQRHICTLFQQFFHLDPGKDQEKSWKCQRFESWNNAKQTLFGCGNQCEMSNVKLTTQLRQQSSK